MHLFQRPGWRAGLLSALLAILLFMLGSVAVAAPQTLVILGASGSPGQIDPYTEVSQDNGATWGPAYLYGWHPWGFVPGTNSWINCGPSGTAYCLNTTVLYRVRFNVPEGATNTQMTFDVKADNYATIWVNGNHAAEIVGANSAAVDSSITASIVPGLNEIRLSVKDEGGWAGFNYKITLTMDAPTPPSTVSLAPAISDIADQMTAEDTPIGPVTFSVNDQDTPAESLAVTAVSSNQALLPNANVMLGGTGATRTLVLMPAPNQNGTATVTVTVSDGALSASDTFTLTVTPVDDAPSLTVGGISTYTENGQPVVVASSLTINDPSGGNIPGARVAIGTGFDAAQDQLGMQGQTGTSGTVNGLNWSYNTGTGIMTVSGNASAATYEQVLRMVTYRNLSEAPSVAPRTVDFSLGSNSLYLPATGHFYEYVPGNITWTNARNRAASIATYGQPGYPSGMFGLQGYLATIGSLAENTFAASKLQGNGWIGASDYETEGTWKWVTGPEAGTIFSYQNRWGWCSAVQAPGVNGQYANWHPGEPNDCGYNEDVAHFYADTGTWNDFPDGAGVAGYVVEYGGMPGDPALQLTGSAQVNVVAVNDAPTIPTSIGHFAVGEGGPAVTVPFVIGDVDSPLSQLTLSVVNSSPSRFTATLGGSGASRTVTVFGLDDTFASSVTLIVSDGQAEGSLTFQVTVENVAPLINAGPDAVINSGEAFSSSGSFVDPGADTWTATVDYGDGSGTQPLALSGKNFTLSHVYTRSGTYTVDVKVSDDDGATRFDTVTVTVRNTTPTVNAGADTTVDEGSTFTSTGSFTDDDPADTWTATVDYGDGSGAQPLTLSGKSFTLSHVYADNGTYTVTVTVTDREGAADTETFIVTVNNLAPVVNAGSDGTLVSGQTLQVSATFTDAGVLDTHAATVDWGDGSGAQTAAVSEGNGSGTVTAAKQFFSPGTYTVQVCVTDKDGSQTCDSLTLTVNRLQIRIDIKPGNGSGPNPINLKEKGSTPVGVLSGTYDGFYLDTADIKADSVVFEGAPNQLIGQGPTDLDGDGDLDQVFHFQTAQVGLSSTSVSGTLKGVTNAGIHFEGTDSVRIVGK